MLAQIGKFLWDRPSLMATIAFIGALATIFCIMWLTGDLPESSPNKLNILREGIKIPRQ